MDEISIKTARKRKGITQLELADMLHTHQTSVAGWEQGKWHPTAKHLLEMSKLLDCSVDELLAPDETEASA